eukprot:4817589-Prymnesium_polylepis.1
MLDDFLCTRPKRLARIRSPAARVSELDYLPGDDIASDVRYPRCHRRLQVVQVARDGTRTIAVLQRALLPVFICVLRPG